jgi:hypothetical protein
MAESDDQLPLSESCDELPDALPLSPVPDELPDALLLDVVMRSRTSSDSVLRFVPAKPLAKARGRPRLLARAKQQSDLNIESVVRASWAPGLSSEALNALANWSGDLVPSVVSVPGLRPMPIALMHAVSASADLGVAHIDTVWDQDIHSVASHLCSNSETPYSSVVVLSKFLNVEVRTIRVCLHRSATTLNLFCSSRCLSLQRSIFDALPRRDLCELIEFVQYDETPLPTRVAGDAAPNSDLAEFRPHPVPALTDVSPGSMICKIGATGTLQVQASKAPVKAGMGLDRDCKDCQV